MGIRLCLPWICVSSPKPSYRMMCMIDHTYNAQICFVYIKSVLGTKKYFVYYVSAKLTSRNSRRSSQALVSRRGRHSCLFTVSICRILHTYLRHSTVRRMTVPPNALAAFSIWAAAYATSKYKRRAIFIALAGVVAIIGKCL